MLASSLALAIGIYAVGVTRLWRSAGYGRGVRPFEALAYTAGCAALVIALSPPLDEWSERWLAAHMVQHELLMVVAAPLIAVGAPVGPIVADQAGKSPALGVFPKMLGVGAHGRFHLKRRSRLLIGPQ